MALHFYVSTSLESLAGTFLEKIYKTGTGNDPLKPVIATVQTQGIATWLKQYIANNSKIAMNLKMPFLRSAVEQTVKEYYPTAEEELGRHSVDRDTWKIFHYLSLKKTEIPELAAYLKNDPDMRKQYQISRQIAMTFEQYRTYRPELVSEWCSQEQSSVWQAKIYRELFSEDLTLDRYMTDFISKANEYTGDQFRKGLSIFGISSMPPRFLQFFLALAKYQDVSLFYLAPSADYWENKKKKDREESEQNPLLQSLGVQGRAFFDELLSSETWNCAEEYSPLYSEPGTMLECLQDDIRGNRNISRQCSPDGSILIENCHTPLREIEILHDRLLHEIKTNSRKPGEILVTAPNIENYVPHIESVFGTGPLADCYSIADRSLKDSGTILPALLRILHLPDSNYNNSDIFSLLEEEALQNKFRLTVDDVQQIHDWCSAAGIRWGIDGSHREKVCGVNFESFSWRQGVRRLLFGYAVGEEFDSQLKLPELPIDFAEGSGAEKFGCFLDLLDELFLLKDEFSGEKTPKLWFEKLKELPDKFFLTTEPVAVQERAQLIHFLAEQAFESRDCTAEVPFPVILDILENTDFSASSGSAFLRGKITFCSMVPMRTIPMKVIAILGLNAGEFPRRDTAPGFNLIAKDMKKTDRSKNLEDRYLLLETLLAAKEKLMIFYNGQNEKDNSEVFPTPPLAEIIQYLQRLDKTNNRKAYIVKHNLQSYADSYFDGSDLLKYSYSATALEAAEAKKLPAKTFTSNIVIPDLELTDLSAFELPEKLSLNELEHFYRSPMEFYLSRKNIGKFTRFGRSSQENEEMFLANALEAYDIKKNIVQYAAAWVKTNPGKEIDFQELRNYLVKTVKLPYQEIGKELFESMQILTTRLLAEEFLTVYSGQQEEYFEVICPVSPGREMVVTGTVPVSADHTRSVMFRNSRNKPKHQIDPWLRHVFLSAALPEYHTTVCQFEDEEMKLAPLDHVQAREHLLHLAQIRSMGESSPVPFFREVAQVNENATGKQRVDPVNSSNYCGQVEKAICNDYCASLFFKKSDLDEDFRRLVCRAANKVYSGRVIVS
ncbi:MAG: exodeoxyribonuclease V subunit gamma [Lentisphaerae bacterium]|nr:exodeoxyribonuclease V subunit gamma [Lentisphaerota bacterium]